MVRRKWPVASAVSGGLLTAFGQSIKGSKTFIDTVGFSANAFFGRILGNGQQLLFNGGSGASNDGHIVFCQANSTEVLNINCLTVMQLANQAAGTGKTINVKGSLNRTQFKITLTAAAWIAAALTQDINLGDVPAKARVVSVVADVTTAFAGLAGTITLSVGKTAGGAQYIAAFDCKTAAVTKGLADADMGASLTRAAAIQGGDLPSWSGATTLSARLTSGTGNIGTGAATNLSQGTVTIYITVDYQL